MNLAYRLDRGAFPPPVGRAIAYGFHEDGVGLLGLSRLRERPTRSQSGAGEGSHPTGISSAILDNPDAEIPPPQPSPAGGRGSPVPTPPHRARHMLSSGWMGNRLDRMDG